MFPFSVMLSEAPMGNITTASPHTTLKKRMTKNVNGRPPDAPLMGARTKD